jgi:hypothetical protein
MTKHEIEVFELNLIQSKINIAYIIFGTQFV